MAKDKGNGNGNGGNKDKQQSKPPEVKFPKDTNKSEARNIDRKIRDIRGQAK